jgi:hypothetical protein
MTGIDWQSLAVAALGAFFGALGAQIISSRYQTKQAVVVELNNVRATLTLCFSICNRFISLKRQLVRPMRNDYVQARQEYDDFNERAKTYVGPPRLIYELPADLKTFSMPAIPTAMLERELFEKISISGRALHAAIDLLGAIDGLEKSIGLRNDLIAEIHKRSPVPGQALTEMYFGIPTADGVTDERFSGSVIGIFDQTDDCIFFSHLLSKDLTIYGRQLRRRYAWRYRLRVPKIQGADWTIAEQQGLIPPDALYADWLRGFKAQRLTKWARLKAWLAIRQKLT